MMKHKLTGALLLSLTMVFSIGCEGLLDTDPQQSVAPEIALGTPEGMRAVYYSTYNRITHHFYYGRRLMTTGDALGDNAVGHPTTSGRYTSEPQNAIGAHIGGWNRYLQINEINLILQYAENVLSGAELNRTLGEMYFMRALSYHDLMKVYAYEPGTHAWQQGVILRLEPTETFEQAMDFKERASVQEVYQQIESDLQQAISFLGQADGNAPYFANRAAAHALLARVYLYWQRWADAEAQATLALQHTTANVAQPGQVAGMFANQPNVESLFELRYTISEGRGVNESMQSLLTPPGHYDLIPSEEFLATLAEEDVRNALYPLDQDVYPDHATGHRFVRKFDSSIGTWVDNVPVIRISEVYLTRAEARAEQNKTAEALADLNTIRSNRGLDDINVSGAALIDEILTERRRELAFEGHRFHDLKRRGMNIIKPSATGRPPLTFGEDFVYIARIPISEVDLNPVLVQNPGY